MGEAREGDEHDEGAADAPTRWNHRYVAGTTGWDRGQAPRSLLDLIASGGLPAFTGGLEVLVPGAGHGHDAMAWVEAGHRVTAVDFAPRAVELLRDSARARGLALEVVEADVLELPDHWGSRFDLVWEQTCLCALPPEHREGYLRSMARVLREGGELHGLFWNHGRPGGPPYDLPRDLVEALMQPHFDHVSWQGVEPPQDGRQGEALGRFRRSKAQAASSGDASSAPG